MNHGIMLFQAAAGMAVLAIPVLVILAIRKEVRAAERWATLRVQLKFRLLRRRRSSLILHSPAPNVENRPAA